jgi:hypothetical protein
METSGPYQKKLTPTRGRGAGVSPAITAVITQLLIGALGSVVVKALCYNVEGREFETR